MPLLGEYSWKETAAAVHLRVALKGCSAKQVDVYAADVYLKISYPPRLIELDLVHEVDEDGAKAKRHAVVWGALVVDKGSLSKEATAERRRAATERRSARERDIAEAAKSRRTTDDRLALRTMMNLESEERGAIESLKTQEKEEAEAEVYERFKELQIEEAQRKRASDAAAEKERRLADEAQGAMDMDMDDGALEEKSSEPEEKEEMPHRGGAVVAAPVVPAPRRTTGTVVTVSHTPRIFPTPMRESKLVEENDWISRRVVVLELARLLAHQRDEFDFLPGGSLGDYELDSSRRGD